MHPEEYAVARRGRLIEHALALGVPEASAATVVDGVLREQRRVISRAGDPDPAVHAALEQAVNPPPPPSPTKRRLLVAAALLAVGGLAATTYAGLDDGSRPAPSLFGYDEAGARAALAAQGFRVEEQTARMCEVAGRVVRSEPAPGQPVEDGATITIWVASPVDSFCMSVYPDRADGWILVDHAAGRGPAPRVAPDLAAFRGEDEVTYDEVLEEIARATRDGGTELQVSARVPPSQLCGTPRPAALDGRQALSVSVVDDADDDCHLTVDLYRTDGVIDAVVLR